MRMVHGVIKIGNISDVHIEYASISPLNLLCMLLCIYFGHSQEPNYQHSPVSKTERSRHAGATGPRGEPEEVLPQLATHDSSVDGLGPQ